MQKCLIVLCKKDISLMFFSPSACQPFPTQTVVAQLAVRFTASLKTVEQGETMLSVSLI